MNALLNTDLLVDSKTKWGDYSSKTRLGNALSLIIKEHFIVLRWSATHYVMHARYNILLPWTFFGKNVH